MDQKCARPATQQSHAHQKRHQQPNRQLKAVANQKSAALTSACGGHRERLCAAAATSTTVHTRRRRSRRQQPTPKLKIVRSERMAALEKNPNSQRHIIITRAHTRDEIEKAACGRANWRAGGVMSSRLHIEPERTTEGWGNQERERARERELQLLLPWLRPGEPCRWTRWTESVGRERDGGAGCCWSSAAQTAYNCNPRTQLGSALRRHSLMRYHEQKTHTQGPHRATGCVYYQPGYTALNYIHSPSRAHTHQVHICYVPAALATLANCVIISGRAQFAKQVTIYGRSGIRCNHAWLRWNWALCMCACMTCIVSRQLHTYERALQTECVCQGAARMFGVCHDCSCKFSSRAACQNHTCLVESADIWGLELLE